MKKNTRYPLRSTITLLVITLFLSVTGSAAAAGLFFSEYMEGSSFNKALEIHNGTKASVDLAAEKYRIEIYFKGNASPGRTIGLEGILKPASSYVIANGDASIAIREKADQLSGSLLFNGDDAVVLKRNGIVIDTIGQTGFDPGDSWGAGASVTKDSTLRRKSSICRGDVIMDDPFDPALEWDGLAKDTFDGLGLHTAQCAAP